MVLLFQSMRKLNARQAADIRLVKTFYGVQVLFQGLPQAERKQREPIH